MAQIHTPRISWLCRAALCGAAVFSTLVIAAVWLQLLDTGLWQVPLSLFGAGALIGVIWDTRLRANRRLLAVADVYAEREIAREMKRPVGVGGRG